MCGADRHGFLLLAARRVRYSVRENAIPLTSYTTAMNLCWACKLGVDWTSTGAQLKYWD